MQSGNTSIFTIGDQVLSEQSILELKYPNSANGIRRILFHRLAEKRYTLFPKVVLSNYIIIGQDRKYFLHLENEQFTVYKTEYFTPSTQEFHVATEIRHRIGRLSVNQNPQSFREREIRELVDFVLIDSSQRDKFVEEVTPRINDQNWALFKELLQLQQALLEPQNNVIKQLQSILHRHSGYATQLLSAFYLWKYENLEFQQFTEYLYQPLITYHDILDLELLTDLFNALYREYHPSKILLRPFSQILHETTFLATQRSIGNRIDWLKLQRLAIKLGQPTGLHQSHLANYYNNYFLLSLGSIGSNQSSWAINNAFTIWSHLIRSEGSITDQRALYAVNNYIRFQASQNNTEIEVDEIDQIIEIMRAESSPEKSFAYYQTLASLIYYRSRKLENVEEIHDPDLQVVSALYTMVEMLLDPQLSTQPEVLREHYHHTVDMVEAIRKTHRFWDDPLFMYRYRILPYISEVIQLPLRNPILGLEGLEFIYQKLCDDEGMKFFVDSILSKLIIQYVSENLDDFSKEQIYSFLQNIEFLEPIDGQLEITPQALFVKLIKSYFDDYTLGPLDRQFLETISKENKLLGDEEQSVGSTLRQLYQYISTLQMPSQSIYLVQEASGGIQSAKNPQQFGTRGIRESNGTSMERLEEHINHFQGVMKTCDIAESNDMLKLLNIRPEYDLLDPVDLAEKRFRLPEFYDHISYHILLSQMYQRENQFAPALQTVLEGIDLAKSLPLIRDEDWIKLYTSALNCKQHLNVDETRDRLLLNLMRRELDRPLSQLITQLDPMMDRIGKINELIYPAVLAYFYGVMDLSTEQDMDSPLIDLWNILGDQKPDYNAYLMYIQEPSETEIQFLENLDRLYLEFEEVLPWGKDSLELHLVERLPDPDSKIRLLLDVIDTSYVLLEGWAWVKLGTLLWQSQYEKLVNNIIPIIMDKMEMIDLNQPPAQEMMEEAFSFANQINHEKMKTIITRYLEELEIDPNTVTVSTKPSIFDDIKPELLQQLRRIIKKTVPHHSDEDIFELFLD